MFLFAYYYKVNIFTYILRIFYMISLIDTKKFPGVTKRNVL